MDEQAHIDWRVCRRIGAVGLLWNRPSDAWLGIDGLNAASRAAAFDRLEVRHVWLEDGVRETKRLRAQLGACMNRLARMNGCAAGELPEMQTDFQSKAETNPA